MDHTVIDSKWQNQTLVDPRQNDTLTERRESAIEVKRQAYRPKLRRNPVSGELEPAQAQGKAENWQQHLAN